MKLIELILSLCMLMLVIAVAGSLLAGIGETAIKTISIRKQMYDQQQIQIDVREAENAHSHP